MDELDYTVIYTKNVIDLERTVRKFIEEGWFPQGGISAVYVPGRGSENYIQAMIRTKKPLN